MSIVITRPSEPIAVSTLVVTLFGQPGIGKTSIAYTARKPLLLDFDGGAQRAVGRKDTVRVTAWENVTTISSGDVGAYDTIVIDTVGRALEYLAADLVRTNPKLARQSGELSMQGYGAIKAAFAQWLGRVRTFGKSVILVAHEKEEKDGDAVVIRIDAMGATRTEVVRLSDLVGFVSAGGNGRTLDFNPTERHTGKNCVALPILEVPDLRTDVDWFGDLLDQSLAKMNGTSEAMHAKEIAMATVKERISAIGTAADLTSMISEVGTDPVLKKALMARARALNCAFDKIAKAFQGPSNDVAA